jgi:hypothetical protein
MALLTHIAAQAEGTVDGALARTMNQIRAWLDGELIEPVQFRTVVGRTGLEFEISFRNEHEAERFQEQFASLLTSA